MRDMTLTDLERAAAAVGEDEAPAFAMEEEAFRVFYERTARSVWAYLSRMTGDGHLADDLLQDTYYRFLRARAEYASDAHRRDRRRPTSVPIQDGDDHADTRAAGDVAERAGTRTDVSRALAQLRPRDRQLLWLAYAQEMTHKEIAEGLGLKTASIKLLLWRARRRLMGLLRRPEGLRPPGHRAGGGPT